MNTEKKVLKNKKRIGIITYHSVINNGAVLQAKGLQEKMNKLFPEHEIEIINYYSPYLEMQEVLKCMKLNSKKPLFHLKRYLLFKLYLKKFLPISREKYIGSLVQVITKINRNYKNDDVIITGSDCVWGLNNNMFNPKFPNIYWLPDRINAQKISYAPSAFNSDLEVLNGYKNLIGNYLSRYSLISVRDEFTKKIIDGSNFTEKIYRVPDPAFFYKIRNTNVKKKLIKLNIDLSKPMLAILTSYKDERIKEITTYFKDNQFQVIALSMYNPHADFNLGDELLPDEWAEVFKYMDFCVSDRFHGTIFCIKNLTPFIAIETKGLSKERSKKHQLVSDFNLNDCYINLYTDDYDINKFIDKYRSISDNWGKYRSIIKKEMKVQMNVADEFLAKLKAYS